MEGGLQSDKGTEAYIHFSSSESAQLCSPHLVTFLSSGGLGQLPKELHVTQPAGCHPALLPSAALGLCCIWALGAKDAAIAPS